jgi:hypothetical protein
MSAVALVMTILGVVGVLGAMALLLWFSAMIEAKQLGPREPAPAGEPEPLVPAPGPVPKVVAPAPDGVPAGQLGTAA